MKEIFSTRVLSLRKERGISQAALAEAVGLSNDAICTIETKRRLASMEALARIADYFDVSTDYLIGRSDDPARH